MTRKRMGLTSGSKLGPYEIVSLLGAGGMGEVYRAHDSRLGRDVAIKVLSGDLSSDPDLKARFEQKRERFQRCRIHTSAISTMSVRRMAPTIW